MSVFFFCVAFLGFGGALQLWCFGLGLRGPLQHWVSGFRPFVPGVSVRSGDEGLRGV